MNATLTCLLTLAIAFCFTKLLNAEERIRETPTRSAKLTSELTMKTERVIVFKDGYGLIVKRGTARTNEHGAVFSDEVPDSAILGSFWAIPTHGTIKSMVAGWVKSESERTRNVNCTNLVEIIKANLGKKCSLVIPGKDEKVLHGTLLKLLTNDELTDMATASRMTQQPGQAGESSAVSVSQVTGSNFILRTDAGDMMIPIATVRDLTIDGMESTLQQKVTETTHHKRLTLNFGKPNADVEINLMYFRPDVRWIPTYRVNLTDKQHQQRAKKKTEAPIATTKTAEIFMQGELLNEAEDFTDVPFHVVVGVPNFRFRSVPSPMVLESSLRNLLAQAAPNIMGNQSQMSNALYTQRSGEFRSNRSSGNASRATVDFPAELSGSGGNDLFVYKLDNLSLKKGERATVPILRTEVAYRDVYTWDIELIHAESFAASSADTPSPLVLTQNKVWRQVELINDTDIPWTTGAAMFVDGFQPLAQELLTYTSPGGICRVPVTVSVDLRGKVEDQETKRELKALTWRHNEYARVHGRIDIELANNKREAVPVEVRVRFGGKPDKVSDDGQKTLEAFRAEDWHNRQGDAINNSSTIFWKSSIEPGECFKPTVDYEFFLRY